MSAVGRRSDHDGDHAKPIIEVAGEFHIDGIISAEQ